MYQEKHIVYFSYSHIITFAVFSPTDADRPALRHGVGGDRRSQDAALLPVRPQRHHRQQDGVPQRRDADQH